MQEEPGTTEPGWGLAVLATCACVGVLAFGAWWDARMAPSFDDSEMGRGLGTGVLKLGVAGAVVLLVGLVAVLSARPALVRLGPRLWWWSLLTSGTALAAVVAFLI